MMYTELHEYLPDQFEMLLVASPANCGERDLENIVCLSTPLKVHELLQTVEMMDYTITRRQKKQREKPKQRSKDEQEMIAEAKALLMERNNMTEEEAHRYIQSGAWIMDRSDRNSSDDSKFAARINFLSNGNRIPLT